MAYTDSPSVGTKRVEVVNVAEPLCDPVADGGDDHAAVAVTDEDHVVQVGRLYQANHVGDVRVQVDRRAEQVAAVAEAGERWRVHVVASLTKA